MSFTIDLTIGIQNPFVLAWQIFTQGGWIPMSLLIPVGLYFMRLDMMRRRYREAKQYVILAIDIPRDNEQSLKAVEQIFAHLYTIESKGTLVDRYWKGKVQDSFSLEIVSIDGYIQFIIRTPEEHRDVVESAIYAQYIDAEITEVHDYTESLPHLYPNPTHDLWGTELILSKREAYPIRTYLQFEHSLPQKFADPMASILEALSRLQTGEQVWIQIIITPPKDSSWIDNSTNLVKKLIGTKISPKKNLLTPITGAASGFLNEAAAQIAGAGFGNGATEESRSLPSKMQFLSPGDRAVVEAIQNKISKIGFRTKIRILYIGKKEVFNKNRGVNPIMGSILQYNTNDLNAFKSHKRIRTRVNYFFVKRRLAARQRKIFRAYKNRANWLGSGEGFILNIEELASIYHFPIFEITAPLVKKTDIKKGGAPMTLPTGEFPLKPVEQLSPVAARPSPTSSKAEAPENLPFAPE